MTFRPVKFRPLLGSSLEVDLEEQYITNENDEIMGDPTYRIKKVHSVDLPMKQRRLEFKNENPKDN